MAIDLDPPADRNAPTLFSEVSRWFARVAALLFAWVVLVVAFASLEPSLSRGIAGLIPRLGPATLSPAPVARQSFGVPAIGCVSAASAPAASAAAAASTPTGLPAEVARREIRIDLHGEAPKVERAVSLDRCGENMTRLREAMSRWVAGDDVEQIGIRGQAFGFISMDVASLRFAAPGLAADGENLVLATVVDAATAAWFSGRPPGDAYQLRLQPGDWDATTRVVVKHDKNTQVWSERPTHRTAEDEMEWTLPAGDRTALVLRVIPAPVVIEKSVTEKPLPTEPLLVRAAGGKLDVLRPLWLGLTYVLPFLAMLWWSGRRQARPREVGAEIADALVAGCRTAAALIAVLVVAESAEYIVRLDSKGLREGFGLQNLWWSSVMLKSAVIALAWPLFARAIAQPRVGRSGSVSAAVAALLLVGALATIYWDKQAPHLDTLSDIGRSLGAWFDGKESPQDQARLWMFGALALALALAAWAGSRALVGGSLLLAASLVIGAVAMMLLYAMLRGKPTSLIGVVAALPFGWAFARASRAWVPTAVRGPPRPDSSGFLVLGALVAALLAAPVDLQTSWSFSWLLGTTAWALARLWELPALALLVWWLARRGADRAAADDHRDVQGAGVLLVFAIFYWRPQQAWLPLIASATIGVLLLTQWLFRDHHVLPALFSRPRRLARAIAYIRGYHRLQRLSQSLRKGLVAKIEKGESTLQAARRLAEPMDRLVDQRAGTARSQRRRLLRALNEGSPQSPWRRGADGALLATAIGLPWIVTYLTSTLHGTAPTNAEVLSRLCVVILDAARWPALGFFFLYFYPRLRGSNGIEKGLALAITLLLPQLVATSVDPFRDSEQWRALAFWSLQIFIACMTLGVALGDLGALRQAGRRAGSLIEIYNLGTLAAWSSSLAIAVGAAVVTVLAGQAGTLFTAGLKLLLPELQPPH